ncbi:hypothetical protein K443DRAFT_123626 [Laccaria amethystina LaAM-08-1]|uniref:Retrotransposon gag domain-containing protein n=1 Tax=Laccaria amethystina LaAM-08-1 TaxID=1095629 RepID=A0A0C9X030_9AGAR|nr:hypothetical protein K443DRAFT_123626 [Laccaria amethystina LaAM-08-1]
MSPRLMIANLRAWKRQLEVWKTDLLIKSHLRAISGTHWTTSTDVLALVGWIQTLSPRILLIPVRTLLRLSGQPLHEETFQVNKQVFVLSYYLKGKAYNYYTQKVSMNYRDWTLWEFFEQMFNYCFPVNYRMAQRQKLKKCFQNEKTVSEYIHELEELFNMIGIVDNHEKLIKLWNGLRSSIQRALWRDRYNPEISEWDDVRDRAETIKISESVPDQQRKNNNSGTHHVHPNNGNSCNKKHSGNRNPGSSNNFQRGSSQAPSGQRNNNFSRGSSRPQSQQPKGNFNQNNSFR